MTDYRQGLNQQGMDYLMKQGVYSQNQISQPYSYAPQTQPNLLQPQITPSQGFTTSNQQNQQTIQLNNTPPKSLQGVGQSQIYIANLNWWTTDQDLEELLNASGMPLDNIQFLEEKYNGKSKGCAIVKCGSLQIAQQCISLLNGKEFQGKKLAVSIALKEYLSQLDSKEPQGNQNLNLILPQSPYQSQPGSQQMPSSQIQSSKVQYLQTQPQNKQQNLIPQSMMPPTQVLGGQLGNQQGLQFPVPPGPPPVGPPQTVPRSFMVAPPQFPNRQ